MSRLSVEDLRRGVGFLYSGRGFLEVNAVPSGYVPGRQHFRRNLERGTLPKVAYFQDVKALERWAVKEAGPERLLLCGVQSRAEVLQNRRGYARAASDRDVSLVETVFWDLDFPEKKRVTASQVAALEDWLDGRADEYFRDVVGVRSSPVRSFSGRGMHLFLALPPVRVAEYPDVKGRLRMFCDRFCAAHRQDLSRLEVVGDRTHDLARKVRLPGSAKPGVGIVSRFYGDGRRREDPAVRDYLLGLSVRRPAGMEGALSVGRSLPVWFESLLQRDREVAALWRGTGKPDGTDSSRSGYDFSLLRQVVRRGYRDVDELATILVLRPNSGAAEKGESYLRRTVAAALARGSKQVVG